MKMIRENYITQNEPSRRAPVSSHLIISHRAPQVARILMNDAPRCMQTRRRLAHSERGADILKRRVDIPSAQARHRATFVGLLRLGVERDSATKLQPGLMELSRRLYTQNSNYQNTPGRDMLRTGQSTSAIRF